MSRFSLLVIAATLAITVACCRAQQNCVDPNSCPSLTAKAGFPALPTSHITVIEGHDAISADSTVINVGNRISSLPGSQISFSTVANGDYTDSRDVYTWSVISSPGAGVDFQIYKNGTAVEGTATNPLIVFSSGDPGSFGYPCDQSGVVGCSQSHDDGAHLTTALSITSDQPIIQNASILHHRMPPT